MTSTPTLQPSPRARGTALAARFATIARTRMDGVALLHPGLAVQAVGFAPAVGGGAVGVLVTPWFMNLVWLPLTADDAPAAPGRTQVRVLGGEVFPFIGAYEDGFGGFEACSLFSPMHEFVDQAAALATAQAVLDQLRAADKAAPTDGGRRAMLLGRAPEARR
jgi:[NiFe] hydrogenase assembly HybE family chaperone